MLHNILLYQYYLLKPFIPRSVQLYIRTRRAIYKRNRYSNIWPIDKTAGTKPPFWRGWPYNKKFALVLTHDVETKKGVQRCSKLAELDSKYGLVSSFNFVIEEFPKDLKIISDLKKGGFEIGIHGLKHDGRLYLSKKKFKKATDKINQYIKNWDAKGFRSPSVLVNLSWLHALDIDYDSSTFDTDPFEPYSQPVNTIFPFIVRANGTNRDFVELPYTLPQDFTLFILLKEKTIEIWKRKLDWIAENGGMALLITHPDYMNFNGKSGSEEYPASLYEDFLKYIKGEYNGAYINLLPKEVAHLCLDGTIQCKVVDLQ